MQRIGGDVGNGLHHAHFAGRNGCGAPDSQCANGSHLLGQRHHGHGGRGGQHFMPQHATVSAHIAADVRLAGQNDTARDAAIARDPQARDSGPVAARQHDLHFGSRRQIEGDGRGRAVEQILRVIDDHGQHVRTGRGGAQGGADFGHRFQFTLAQFPLHNLALGQFIQAGILNRGGGRVGDPWRAPAHLLLQSGWG